MILDVVFFFWVVVDVVFVGVQVVKGYFLECGVEVVGVCIENKSCNDLVLIVDCESEVVIIVMI